MHTNGCKSALGPAMVLSRVQPLKKKLSILNGEVFFVDKDLLMGADHEERLLHVDSRCDALKRFKQVSLF